MAKCPYTFPHRSRAARLAYLNNNMQGHYDSDLYPVSFNVKVYNVNEDMDHLWGIWSRDDMPDEVTENPKLEALFKEHARAVRIDYVARPAGGLFRQALEQARENVCDTDTHKSLWSGEYDARTKFGFAGRQGGHLVVMEWHGWVLRGLRSRDWMECLRDMDGKELDLFYRFYRHWEKDFSAAKVRSEVEYQYADVVFRAAASTWGPVYQKWLQEQGPKFGSRVIRVRPTAKV